MSKKDEKEKDAISSKKKEDMTTEELSEYVTKEAKKEFIMDLGPYLIIIFFVVIIRMFIASPVRVNGSSMYPTLQDGDNMILYKLSKHTRGIKRFDIVVVNTEKDKLIKRVIGLPGDKIKYEVTEDEDGKKVSKLFVNGKEVIEDFITDDAKKETCNSISSLICSSEYIVPEEEYFVMGDNRGDSLDSRILGSIKYKDIAGITNLVFFPFNRIGTVK